MIPLSLVAPLLSVQTFREPFPEQSPIVDNISSSPLNAKFDALVNSTLSDWHVPGLAVAVIDGHNTYSKVGTNI
jgi:hypothetical protein